MSCQTVYLIDDDPSVLKALSRLIRAAEIPVESFPSAIDFLKFDRDNAHGCIVLDVRMRKMSGLELQDELNKQNCQLPIIFISAHGDIPMATKTLKKGAVDFLTKPVCSDDLLASIEDSFDKDRMNRKAREKQAEMRQKLVSLTPREYEIMTYVITGMLNKQIAGELNIVEDTVKIHRGRMMRKLNIVSVAELVRMCEKAGVEAGKVSGA